MPRDRDPFPFPKYENDHAFTGIKPCQVTFLFTSSFNETRLRFIEFRNSVFFFLINVQKIPFKKPTHIAHNEEPWSRLNDSPTFSSMRRSVLYHKEVSWSGSMFNTTRIFIQRLLEWLTVAQSVFWIYLVLLFIKAPKDSLDFHLSAAYDNHLDFLLNKNETLFQRDTLMRDRGWGFQALQSWWT